MRSIAAIVKVKQEIWIMSLAASVTEPLSFHSHPASCECYFWLFSLPTLTWNVWIFFWNCTCKYENYFLFRNKSWNFVSFSYTCLMCPFLDSQWGLSSHGAQFYFKFWMQFIVILLRPILQTGSINSLLLKSHQENLNLWWFSRVCFCGFCKKLRCKPSVAELT